MKNNFKIAFLMVYGLLNLSIFRTTVSFMAKKICIRTFRKLNNNHYPTIYIISKNMTVRKMK